MIRFWDFQLTGAPPPLSCVVRPQEEAQVLGFLVDSISDDEHIIGRNGDCDIGVGTTFTTVRRYRTHQADGQYRTEDLGESVRVALILVGVLSNQRRIDVVPGGHTAALIVTGEGHQVLAALLGELPSNEYLWLVAAGREEAEQENCTGAAGGVVGKW